MDKYGLIGFPLKHSFSQQFFTNKFAVEGIDARYEKFEIPNISEFKQIIESNPDLRGLNVTIPYKEKVIPFLDGLDSGAEDIGAVNVVKFVRNNEALKLIGYNSDIIGFEKSISPLLNDYHSKALILGTGGASKAVRKGLQSLGIYSAFVSRTAKDGILSYADLNEDVMAEYKVVVNTTPLGTFPDIDAAAEIPYHLLTEHHLLYDLVYNPSETKFLRLGKENGAAIKNGYEMLELQALAAWDIWNG